MSALGRTRSTFRAGREWLALPSRRYRNIERVLPRSHVQLLTVRAGVTRAPRLQDALSGCASSVAISPGRAHESCATARAVIATHATLREANSLLRSARCVPPACAPLGCERAASRSASVWSAQLSSLAVGLPPILSRFFYFVFLSCNCVFHNSSLSSIPVICTREHHPTAATTIPRGQSTRFWEATCHVVVGECHLCVFHVYKLCC